MKHLVMMVVTAFLLASLGLAVLLYLELPKAHQERLAKRCSVAETTSTITPYPPGKNPNGLHTPSECDPS
jgi:hypothetical protein